MITNNSWKTSNIENAMPTLIYKSNFIQNGWWESVQIQKRGESRKKNANITNVIQKINLHTKFYPNQRMGMHSKSGGERLGQGVAWGRRNFNKKKGNRHKWHPKINSYSKFHQNWMIGKCSKNRGNSIGGKGGIWERGRIFVITNQKPCNYAFAIYLAPNRNSIWCQINHKIGYRQKFCLIWPYWQISFSVCRL